MPSLWDSENGDPYIAGLFTLDIITLFITTLLVSNRLYIRIFRHWGWHIFHRDAWSWSDAFVILAWLSTLPNVIYYCLTVNWELEAMEEPEVSDSVYNQYTAGFTIDFVNYIVFWLPMYFVKAALLCFYGSLIVSREAAPVMWWVTRLTGVLVFVGALTTELIFLIPCVPSSHDLLSVVSTSSLYDEGSCIPIRHLRNYIPVVVFHMGTDLIIFVIPFFLVLRTGLDRQYKAAASFMFALGLISIACSAIMAWLLSGIVQGYVDPLSSERYGWRTITLAVFWRMEPTIAVSLICVPAVRSTFRLIKWHFRGKKERVRINDCAPMPVAAALDLESGLDASATRNDEEADDPGKPSEEASASSKLHNTPHVDGSSVAGSP